MIVILRFLVSTNGSSDVVLMVVVIKSEARSLSDFHNNIRIYWTIIIHGRVFQIAVRVGVGSFGGESETLLRGNFFTS